MAGIHHLPCHTVLCDLDEVLVDSVASIELAVFEWRQLVGADFELVKESLNSLTDEGIIRIAAPDLYIDQENSGSTS